MKIIHIDFPPHRDPSSVAYGKDDATNFSYGLSVQTTAPPSLKDLSEPKRVPPPRAPYDFLPDLMAASDPKFKQRDDVKPLHIIQPEGVSFKVNGHELEWQKWKMHIGTLTHLVIWDVFILQLVMTINFSFQPSRRHSHFHHNLQR